MKPLPRDKRALLEEATSLGLRGPNPSLEQPRAKLLECIENSMKIERSFNHVSILLVGETGVGKSSTINHLLGVDLAGTSETESETRSIKEYIVHCNCPKYEVEELSLGLVDTPVFCDTDGSTQDACNFLFMQRFFRTHPNLSGCYPNLIFVFAKATDNRISGQNSEFRKSLWCLKQLGLVDPNNPNVIVILTHACSIQKKTDEKWSRQLNKIRKIASKIVIADLKMLALVILIENMYDDCNLEHRGDYTVLPNGELQPENLYLACVGVLMNNNDKLGLITLNSIFVESKNENRRITLGHECKAKDAK